MVNDVPNDAVNAKGWFNHVRDVPLARFLDGLLIGLDVCFLNGHRFSGCERDLTRKGRRFWKGLTASFAGTGKGFEGRSSGRSVGWSGRRW